MATWTDERVEVFESKLKDYEIRKAEDDAMREELRKQQEERRKIQEA